MICKAPTMILDLFLVLATAAVLSVYTVIGRLAVPPEDRVPWRELGWAGWTHTLRRSLVFLGDCTPDGNAPWMPAEDLGRQGCATARPAFTRPCAQ